MTRKFILDSSVFLTYASYDKIYRIFDAVITYDLIIFTNEILIDELKINLPQILRIKTRTAEEIIDEIILMTTQVRTVPIFSLSPDPKDNFLFDLAIQTKSELIVTEEKALLAFKESPIKIHNIKWFKENFPVPL